jgi:hypothetical protein
VVSRPDLSELAPAEPSVVTARPEWPGSSTNVAPTANDLATELAAARAEIVRLHGDVHRLQEENRAFLLSMRHMTAAAETVVAEARAEAAETLTRAAAEAYERLVVARADARAAVHEERHRAATELEMLVAVRERIAEERASLTQFHSHLSGRLRNLVHAMLEFADRAPMLDAAPLAHETGVIEAVAQYAGEAGAEPAIELAPRPADMRPADPIGAHDAELEQAFAEFFGGDEHEPSRRWILNDQ